MRLQFEWDDEKAAINFKKHKVLFETAAKVFWTLTALRFMIQPTAIRRIGLSQSESPETFCSSFIQRGRRTFV